MSSDANIQTVENFFAAIGDGDRDSLLALVAENIEWIIPGEGWPLAGTHRGHAGIANVQRKAAEELETSYPRPPEIIAYGDRVFVIGVAMGTIKATGRSFKDEWVFDMTVRDGKVTRIQEYIDTQALSLASRKSNQA